MSTRFALPCRSGESQPRKLVRIRYLAIAGFKWPTPMATRCAYIQRMSKDARCESPPKPGVNHCLTLSRSQFRRRRSMKQFPPQPVCGKAGEDDGEGNSRIQRFGPKRIDDQRGRAEQEERRHRRITPDAIGSRQVRSPSPEDEDRC